MYRFNSVKQVKFHLSNAGIRILAPNSTYWSRLGQSGGTVILVSEKIGKIQLMLVSSITVHTEPTTMDCIDRKKRIN
jgi:S-adenosylmethionine/arginine decarboxylase-like enzyme